MLCSCSRWLRSGRKRSFRTNSHSNSAPGPAEPECPTLQDAPARPLTDFFSCTLHLPVQKNASMTCIQPAAPFPYLLLPSCPLRSFPAVPRLLSPARATALLDDRPRFRTVHRLHQSCMHVKRTAQSPATHVHTLHLLSYPR